MIRPALSSAAAVLALCLALPAATFSLPLRPAPDAPAVSVDDELVQMGQSLPGFGGLFYDAEGYPNVYLRDPQEPTAVAALKSLGSQVRVLQGDFELADLVAWKLSLRSVLARPDVVYLDADEAMNRVVVGIDESSQAKSLVRESLDKDVAAHGVPAAAVVYKEVPRITEMIGVQRVGGLPDAQALLQPEKRAAASLNLVDGFRPVPGGVQTSFIKLPYVYFCTIGFNAYHGTTFGFVTNSHCTADRDEVTGTRYSQGDYHTPAIATELLDPPSTAAPPCPTGRKCRYSDASYAGYDSAATGSLHQVAKPTGRGVATGSLTVRPSTTRFSITASGQQPLVGQTLNKVGRTTGWTFGKVVATCVDVNVSGSTYTVFCQNVVQAGVDSGDSGSTVFSYSTGTAINLVGILWGGGQDNLGHTIFVYSPLAAVQRELGALRVR
jgi:hypothetical protein